MRHAAMVVRRVPLPIFPALLLLLVSSCAAQGPPPPPQFKCSGIRPRCQALLGYVPDNETTYDAIRTLFQVSPISALYGANNVDAATPASTRVLPGTTVKVPFPCACTNGTGVSDERRPTYTVKSGDGLSDIATKIFKNFVTFQQIGDANGVTNYNMIEVGQELWIPLPCSCDAVDGFDTVHLAHAVASGSSIAAIAAEFGTTERTLERINGIDDPRNLQAGQILDVPLRACNSSIRSSSSDYTLRVTNDSYALTAGNCVKCSCSSSSWQLSCETVNSTGSSRTCPAGAVTCPSGSSAAGRIQLGAKESLGACASTRCDYAGFSASVIFAVPVNQSTCGVPPSGTPSAPPPSGTPGSGAHALRPPPWGPSGWAALLNVALIFFAFL